MAAFVTTVVGSMPKRPWLFHRGLALDGKLDHFGKGGEWTLSGDDLALAQDDATRVAIRAQERAGIEIVSDGEQRRKNYVTHLTSAMGGFDFTTLAEKEMRGGRRRVLAGRCVGEIHHTAAIVIDDLRFLLAETDHPVKVTLPGPMTVVDSTVNEFYASEREMGMAWAAAINKEARLLDALGPAVIQFDEPVFSRYPDRVADWGIEALDRCVDGLAAKTAVHVCYGYPQPGLTRPIVDSYPRIIAELEKSSVDQLALEFEGSKLDPALLSACPSKTVLFGCVFNSDEVMETPDHVAERLLAAGRALSPEQVQAAPDCGLVMMTDEKASRKLAIMAEGAAIARERAGY